MAFTNGTDFIFKEMGKFKAKSTVKNTESIERKQLREGRGEINQNLHIRDGQKNNCKMNIAL